MKFWRSVEDYKKICNIPNVKLIHPDIDSQILISKSQGLISVLGSTGFETLFYKKPVILFGEDYYDEVSMVTKIHSFLELNEKIKYALNNYKFNNKEMNVLIQSFENQTLSVPYFSILKDGIVISSIQRIENDFNLTIKNFEKYFETHKQYFQVIANEIYSKI
jgi:archaellum component FlaF (FlaF/FlaG flagellin family)